MKDESDRPTLTDKETKVFVVDPGAVGRGACPHQKLFVFCKSYKWKREHSLHGRFWILAQAELTSNNQTNKTLRLTRTAEVNALNSTMAQFLPRLLS